MSVKLVIQIPCLNEEKTLPLVFKDLPKKIPGINEIEVIIIDDGCTDNTVAVAQKHGVRHMVRHPDKQGLARSFRDGVNLALELGADIIVNTDGDNQYPGKSIPDLVRPLLEGKADIVIANRQVQTIEHFSPTKKLLQRFGTWVLNQAAGSSIPDAPSGFRAYSRDAVMRLNIVTTFSYAMETIIQASHKRLAVVSIPITTNAKTRESRLFTSQWEHVRKSGMAIFRGFVMYRPMALFVTLGTTALLLGLIPYSRFIYFMVTDSTHGARHLQSLIGGSVLLIASFIAFTLGVIADLIRINRILHEETLEQIKHHRFDKPANR